MYESYISLNVLVNRNVRNNRSKKKLSKLLRTCPVVKCLVEKKNNSFEITETDERQFGY